MWNNWNVCSLVGGVVFSTLFFAASDLGKYWLSLSEREVSKFMVCEDSLVICQGLCSLPCMLCVLGVVEMAYDLFAAVMTVDGAALPVLRTTESPDSGPHLSNLAYISLWKNVYERKQKKCVCPVYDLSCKCVFMHVPEILPSRIKIR